MVKVLPIDLQFLPMPGLHRLPCGVLVREWDYAVVYVKSPHLSTKHKFYFTFYGLGDYLLEEVVQLVEQWTFWRGDQCAHFTADSHEFRRARKMACGCVYTYRQKYLAKHGSPPNPLMLRRTLDECLTPTQKKKLFFKPDHSELAQLGITIDNQPI